MGGRGHGFGCESLTFGAQYIFTFDGGDRRGMSVYTFEKVIGRLAKTGDGARSFDTASVIWTTPRLLSLPLLLLEQRFHLTSWF